MKLKELFDAFNLWADGEEADSTMMIQSRDGKKLYSAFDEGAVPYEDCVSLLSLDFDVLKMSFDSDEYDFVLTLDVDSDTLEHDDMFGGWKRKQEAKAAHFKPYMLIHVYPNGENIATFYKTFDEMRDVSFSLEGVYEEFVLNETGDYISMGTILD